MENLETTIRAELVAHAPEVAESIRKQVRYLHAKMVERFGPDLGGVGNSYEYAATYRETVAPFCRGRQLSEELLDTKATKLAIEIVTAWTDKIVSKLGNLDQVDVKRVSGTRYSIIGIRSGRHVLIEQDMIVNVSSKGKLFNQFPARIYLDGNFISAAKYEAAFN